MRSSHSFYYFFFFNDTATTEIYTLSLHDALPISRGWGACGRLVGGEGDETEIRDSRRLGLVPDRKSTRLNSSHLVISYAVFCLKKKKKITRRLVRRHRRYTWLQSWLFSRDHTNGR